MKILFITPYLPSPIRVRSFNFIKGLIKNKHRVHIVSLVESKKEEKELILMSSKLTKATPVLLPKIISDIQTSLLWFLPQPLQCTYAMSINIKRTILEILRKDDFDCVHIEHLRAAQFIPDFYDLCPVIFDAVDYLTPLYQQFISRQTSYDRHLINLIEYDKLKKYETDIISKFKTIIASTNQEAKLISTHAKHSQVFPIENGVDFNYFYPNESSLPKYDLIFSGKMSYFANEQAALYLYKEIMPLVWRSLPQVKLLIAGNGPTRTVSRLSDDKRITVTGYVNNMPDALSKARLAICPIISGAGIQNKILEAMAMAKPVITSKLVLNGLSQVKTGEHLLATDNPQKFAKYIVLLLRNPDVARKIGAAARKYVVVNHNWADKVRRLEQVYVQAIKSTN